MNLSDIPQTPYKHSEIYRTGKTNPRLAQEMLRRNMNVSSGQSLSSSKCDDVAGSIGSRKM